MSGEGLFTLAYIAVVDGKRVLVEHHLSHTTRRGEVVVIADGDQATGEPGYLLVQWHAGHGVSRIRCNDLVSPRYTIRVIDT